MKSINPRRSGSENKRIHTRTYQNKNVKRQKNLENKPLIMYKETTLTVGLSETMRT